jgi:hypothetical protein
MQFSSCVYSNEINQNNFESINSQKLCLIALERNRVRAVEGVVHDGNSDGYFIKMLSVLLELFVTCGYIERQGLFFNFRFKRA